MWMLRADSTRCIKCKHAALCLPRGQVPFLGNLYICRQCSTILLGVKIIKRHVIRASSAFYRATSLPCCVDPRTVSTWGDAHTVTAIMCPVCVAASLNRSLTEYSGTWAQWEEGLKKVDRMEERRR